MKTDEIWFVKLPGESFLRSATICLLTKKVIGLSYYENGYSTKNTFKLDDVEMIEERAFG